MEPSPAARSQRVAALFDRVAETYDAVGVPWFTPIAEALVRELDPRPGEHALDVGCGRGAALFALADAVGPAGQVTGIDLAAAMVAATRADVQTRSLGHVQVHVMDAGAPDLPDESYDVVASSLVLFFLPDPSAALQSWRRLLRVGGRLGVSTFGPQDAAWEQLDRIFFPYLPPQMLDARTSGASGPFSSDDGVAGLLGSAGFDDVRTVGFDLTVDFTEVEAWHRFSWSHGQRAMWEAVPDDKRHDVQDAAFAVLESARDDAGRIRLGQHVRLTLGSRQG